MIKIIDRCDAIIKDITEEFPYTKDRIEKHTQLKSTWINIRFKSCTSRNNLTRIVDYAERYGLDAKYTYSEALNGNGWVTIWI